MCTKFSLELSLNNNIIINIFLVNSGNILMSQKRQRRLSGYGFINVGLPPASPAGSEDNEVRMMRSYILFC